MNPRTLAFAVCCLAAVGLAGCGSEPKAPAATPARACAGRDSRPAAPTGNAA